MFKLRKNYRIPRKTESKYFFLTKNKENATNRTSIGSTTIPKSVWVARATHSDYNRADNSARLYIICHQFNIRDLISNVHFSLTLSRDICVLHYIAENLYRDPLLHANRFVIIVLLLRLQIYLFPYEKWSECEQPALNRMFRQRLLMRN